MYSVISINQPNQLKDIVDIDNKNIFCTSLSLITQLTTRNDFPISNKRIAIINILNFLRFIDCKLKETDSKNNTVPLSRRVLEQYFTRNTYKKYLLILKELRILSAVPYSDSTFYTVSEKCMQYRLHSDFVYATDICLVLFDNLRKIEFTQEGEYNTKMIKTIKEVKINYSVAIRAEIEHYIHKTHDIDSLRKRLNTIFALSSKRFIKRGKKSDRVYHSFSNISRVSRPYLSFNDDDFNDIDIVNCQPLLLCYLLKKRGMGIDSEYIHDCTTGTIYERFVSESFDRDKVKVELYRCIFFDFKPKEEVNKKFKERYPKTWASLQVIDNEKDTLASQLQNIEADIFNRIVPALSEGYFTLFDAVYFTDILDASSIAEYIVNRFKEFDLEVTIKFNNVIFNVVTEAEIIAVNTEVILQGNKEQLRQYMFATKDPITNTLISKVATYLAANNTRITYQVEITEDDFWGISKGGFFHLVGDNIDVSLSVPDMFPFEDNIGKIIGIMKADLIEG